MPLIGAFTWVGTKCRKTSEETRRDPRTISWISPLATRGGSRMWKDWSYMFVSAPKGKGRWNPCTQSVLVGWAGKRGSEPPRVAYLGVIVICPIRTFLVSFGPLVAL